MDLDHILALNGFADPTARDKRKKINGQKNTEARRLKRVSH